MAEEVGHAFVSLVPSARGFSAKTRTELKKEFAGRDFGVPIRPEVDRADVARALAGAAAGQRGAVPIRTDVDAAQLRRETRAAILATQATRPTITVHADVDRSVLRRSLTGMGSAGSSAGRAFVNGFASVVTSKAGLIAVLVAAVSPLAALIAPLTLAGASAAGIFVGAFALRANPKLKSAVTTLFKDIDKGLTAAARPLVGPFLEAIGILRRTAVELAPSVREIFAAVAPYIPQLAEGVSGFLKAFTPGLVQAVKDSAPVMEQLAMVLPELGDALADFLTEIGKVAPEAAYVFGAFMRFTADAIRVLGVLVAKFAEFTANFSIPAIKNMGEIIRQAVLGWGYIIARIALSAEDVVRRIREAWNRLWSNDMVRGVAAGVVAVAAQVRQVPSRIVNALGNVSRLLYQAGRNILQGLIDGIKSKFFGTGSLSSAMSTAASMARSFWPFSPAKQGPLSGRGSLWHAGRNLIDDLTGGMATRLPQVASASTQLAGAVGLPTRGGGALAPAPAVVQVGSDGSRMGDLLVEILREAIRPRGGNVQLVLGQSRG